MSLCCDDAVKMTSSTSIPQCPASEATMVGVWMTSSPLQTGVLLDASSLPGTRKMVFTSKSSWPWKMLRMRLDESVPWLSNNIHRRHTKSSREYFSWTELVKLQFNNSSSRRVSNSASNNFENRCFPGFVWHILLPMCIPANAVA